MQIKLMTRLCTIRLNANFSNLNTLHHAVGLLWTDILDVSNGLEGGVVSVSANAWISWEKVRQGYRCFYSRD